jgi:hypothetical protein
MTANVLFSSSAAVVFERAEAKIFLGRDYKQRETRTSDERFSPIPEFE